MKRRSRPHQPQTGLIRWLVSGLIGLYLGLGLLLRLGQSRLIFHPSSTLDATPADVNLSYEDVRLAAEPGYAHAWWIPAATANAPVLLYLHGNASNIGDLVHRADRFHQLGFAVLLLDYRGYGLSSPVFPTEAIVYEDAQLAWIHLTQARQIPPQQIVVFGQSLGEPWRSNWQRAILIWAASSSRVPLPPCATWQTTPSYRACFPQI